MNKDTAQRFDVDPILEKISSHIPDNEIDSLFPFRKFNTQGRLREFKASQLYRAHILTMIKGVTSFNKVCDEIKSRRSFRDFCRFKNKKSTPVKRLLSEFRDYLKPSGFEEITRLITLTFLNTVKLPLIKVAVPDATDMPANCSGFAKKNVNALLRANVPGSILQKELLKASGLKRAAKALTLLDIRSIHYVYG
ncbi:MAG: transposase [Thermodesulfovibrionia bacterium]|nr:transposase [Thermodesulfovibrionia bacterium]